MPKPSVDWVAFHPNGNSVFTESGDGTIAQFDTLSGQKIRTCPWKGSVYSIDNESIIITEIDYSIPPEKPITIHTYDLETDTILQSQELSVYRGEIHPFPDPSYYFYHHFIGTVGLIDRQTGELTQIIGNFINYLTTAQYSPDGKTICAGNAMQAHIVDTQTGKITNILGGHYFSVLNTRYSENGQYLATIDDNRLIQIWNPDTGELIDSIKSPTEQRDQNYSIDISNDGKRLLTGASSESGNRAIVWDIPTGEPILTIPIPASASPTGSIKPLNYPYPFTDVTQFSPDENYIITLGASDSELAVWNIETGEKLIEFETECRYARDGLTPFSFSPDNRYLLFHGYFAPQRSPTLFGQFSIWDTFSAEQLIEFDGNHAEGTQIIAAQFSPDGQTIMTAGTDNTIRLWKVADLLPQSNVNDFEMYE